jgi:hypothetical protein
MLLDKLEKEREFFLVRGEKLQENIEEKRIKVIDMEMHLKELRKDLALSHNLLDLLRENAV